MVPAGLAVVALAGWYACGLVYLRAAEKALKRYDFHEALKQFQLCLQVWPWNTSTRIQAARAARRGGQVELAERYLSACENGWITRETALERAMFRAQQGELADVESELQGLVLEGHKDTILILEALVRGNMRVRRRRDAVVLLSQLLERESNHAEAYYWRGSQLADGGLAADAVQNYRRALQIAPQRKDFRLALAEALVGSSQPGEAWPHFELLLREQPDDPAAFLGAARCRRALGQHQSAREILDTILRDNSENSAAWAERGRVCREQGDSAEALKSLRRAFELAPYDDKIGFSFLAELRGQRKSKEADDLWKKLQVVLKRANRIRELTLMLNRPGRNAPARFEIAQIHASNGAATEAEAWLLGALQDDPDYKPAHAALAEYYQRIGNSAAADHHRRWAVKVGP
jgi:tetratricopeptide (TPR) repeat protein